MHVCIYHNEAFAQLIYGNKLFKKEYYSKMNEEELLDTNESHKHNV
jgi:hypothetical protein